MTSEPRSAPADELSSMYLCCRSPGAVPKKTGSDRMSLKNTPLGPGPEKTSNLGLVLLLQFCSDAGDQERYQTWRCLHLKDWEELLARVLCKDKI